MMSERFLVAYAVTSGPPVSPGTTMRTVAEWLDGAGGRAFEGGLYQIHDRASAELAEALVEEAFPEYSGRLSCFGFDWLGRQFATDNARGSHTDPEVVVFNVGSGQVLEIPVPFSAFHDRMLVDNGEDALALGFFSQWRDAGGASPAVSECVAYRIPLFLGGMEAVENLELSDLGLYWTLTGQMWRQVGGLADGTPISGVAFEP